MIHTFSTNEELCEIGVEILDKVHDNSGKTLLHK